MAKKSGKAMHIVLWIVQVLLAAAFTGAGLFKLLTPIEQLGAQMPWVLDLPTLVRFIGTSEFLGAMGLLLPSISRVKPGLTPLAALGLMTVMVLAMGFHLSRGETPMIVPNIFLGSLAAFVAWGRSKKAPIAPRKR